MMMMIFIIIIPWVLLSNVLGVNVFAPDRSANDEPLIYRQWNMTSKISHNSGHLRYAPLVTPGESADKPIRLLFWKKNMDIFGIDYSSDAAFSDCGPDLHCSISNDRRDLTQSHVVLFLEQRDRETVSQMKEWQAAAVFVPTSIMSYIDGRSELADVDAVLGYSPRWSDLIVDHSAGWLRFAGQNNTYDDGKEEQVEAKWWARNWMGVYPPDTTDRIYDLAMFNNDCVSLDAVFGGRYAHALFTSLLQESDHKKATIHSYGSCLTSDDLPRRIDCRDPGHVFAEMKRHRFVFIHEVTRTRDFVTEQLYWALSAGAIPVYIGAPNIEDVMPCSGQFADDAPCFLDASKLTPEETAAIILKIKADPQEYARFHKWRVLPWANNVSARFSMLRKGPEGFPCRLCRWYKERMDAL